MLRDGACAPKSKPGKSCVVEAIHLRNFRNLSEVLIDLGEGLNVLEGRNGQGKTNVLEALVLLAGLRSFRGGRFQHMQGPEQDGFRLEARIRAGDETHIIQQVWSKGGRRIMVDDRLLRKSSTLLDLFPLVFFGPDDLEISKGSPGSRRRFLDEALVLCAPEKIGLVRVFQEVLRQRNKALKEMRDGGDPRVLRVYTQAFIQAACALEEERSAFLSSFEAQFQEVFTEITDGNQEVAISFRSPTGNFTEDDAEELDERDRIVGVTLKGPHRADLMISLNGHDVLGWASQGQHRLVVIALKIALLRRIETLRSYQPVLLLDDVSSELDSAYSQLLSSHLLDRGSQVLATTTDARAVGFERQNITHFQVKQGEVKQREDRGGLDR
jgi:DNA replication and repair protein RecF